jgi:hypothetical protein
MLKQKQSPDEITDKELPRPLANKRDGAASSSIYCKISMAHALNFRCLLHSFFSLYICSPKNETSARHVRSMQLQPGGNYGQKLRLPLRFDSSSIAAHSRAVEAPMAAKFCYGD